MGLLDFKKESAEPIVQTDKICHMSSGGGIIDLGNGYSMKVMAVSDKFRVIEIYHHAIGVKPITQNYQQKKVIVEKPKVPEPLKEAKIYVDTTQVSAW
jgi:hypothetical protein